MILQAKLLLDSNTYESWKWMTVDTRRELTAETDPWIAEMTRHVLLSHKMLNHDIVEFNVEESTLISFNVFHSIVKQTATLAGVLILQGNKTFGRCGRNGRNGRKFWYRCIPNDKRLPSFLVPYWWGGIKPTKNGKTNSHFSKNPDNLFVVFRFKQWTHQHPEGELLETLGNVSSLTAFYEYQLYCRSLQSSIKQFVSATRDALHTRNQQQLLEEAMETYSIEDRTHETIYSIDPIHCKDIDDAFHVERLDETTYRVSIYIANVPIWLEILDLWSAFSNRVATIYLPDRKRPMMPTKLSEELCSLHEGQIRFSLALDMILKHNDETTPTSHVVKSSFHLCRINVAKNYSYKSKELETLEMYKHYHELACALNNETPYMERKVLTQHASPKQRVRESHAVISYWMIQMNYITAKTLQRNGTGLFRTTTLQPCKPTNLEHLPQSMLTFLQVWKSSGGSYILLNDIPSSMSHDLLKLDAYVHITSPIRRLPDLLNMIELMRVLKLGFHSSISSISSSVDTAETPSKAVQFYKHWCSTEPLEYMNTSMRAIRRVQQDCELIAKCTKEPERLDKILRGYVFDGIAKNDGLYQYMVYFPDNEWNLMTRCISQHYCEEYSEHMFQIHMFEEGETLRKRLRVELMD